MDSKKKFSFTFITVIIGFMIAIQFQTVKEPAVRDTRDTWQLRGDILKEKELQLKLLREISSNEEKIAQYETKRKQSKEQVLRDTLEELKMEAGLSEVTGPGIIISIEPVHEELLLGKQADSVSPDLLKRLVNELNMYDAKHISIGGRRIINTTVIRDINSETMIDGFALNRLPIEVKVITENTQSAEKLFNRMQVSNTAEEFFIDNLRVKVEKSAEPVTIPAYDEALRIRHMEPVKPDEGGKS
ncbi:DUF881 domain-containing protein [Cytobacillus pseudoceanisediminis]|uniref:NgoFVII family restriction endonuclease n=2 Tax=Cytobacillus TaxID=2675230 RepID=A0ABX3CJ89_9BACI|nr:MULTISPECIES: DUF881 domain-containing protein [Cytobacillus]EFV79503.1 YlxX protein [Bacillus sp. 2_A_57_CT2]MBU8732858.1 DUF881 domain-containing protein [Cytobacillus oceanisediminis]OHX38652.1 NgoFVII family restriction endonuclease [Cytobacillus oceanisediminis]QOK27844.1 DUF881 domain-containing protein [Cytobacillus oceanisediminis]UQX56304.1 DUF881 domain-containing protein [Cytobacillus pseudoceanisediminis]